jgi:hypothetical protein
MRRKQDGIVNADPRPVVEIADPRHLRIVGDGIEGGPRKIKVPWNEMGC